ncbi:hypothetical protein EOM57_01190 [Candidatus Saccharibacteria bacterium]|nr:hypothetical protein [Candidatus Saccharibacteria bacterium]
MKIRLKEKDIEKAEALNKQRKDMLEEVDKMQSIEIHQLIDLHIADIKQYLYDIHREYSKKGYMPGFLKETLEAKFKYYSSHGGNGHGVFLYNALMELPEEEPEKIGGSNYGRKS